MLSRFLSLLALLLSAAPVAGQGVTTPGPAFPNTGAGETCLLRHSRSNACVLRAITNADIAAAKARRRAGRPDAVPANRWRLAGVLPGPVEPGQAMLLDCLAKTPMARPLADWPDDVRRLQIEALAQCTKALPSDARDGDDAASSGDQAGMQDPRFEATMLIGALQQLMGANAVHFQQTGRYAAGLPALRAAGVLTEAPPLPSTAVGGWNVSPQNIVSVSLSAQGRELCRAFNQMLGLPAELGAGAIDRYPAACASDPQGYRVHYRGSPAP